MVGKKLKAFGAQKGWYLGNKSVFGTEDGFLVNIGQSDRMESPSYKTVRVETEPLTDDRRSALQEGLEAQKKALGYQSVAVFDSCVVVTFTESLRSTSPEKLESALQAVVTACRTLGVQPHFSSYTGDGREPFVYNGCGMLLTASERQEMERKLSHAETKRRDQERGYANGVVGAILFGSLGVVAWVLVAYYLNIVSTLLAFGLSFLTVLGYEKWNGTMTGWTKPLLVMVNILLLVAASFFTYYIELYEYDMSIPEAWNYLVFDPQVRGAFLANLGLSIVIGAVGIFVVVANLKTKTESLLPATSL